MISVKYCEIPPYLHDGALYRSLSSDDPQGCIIVPLDCFHLDGDQAVNMEEFTLQLKVMAYWMLDEIPIGVLMFCSEYDVEVWREAVKNIPGSEETNILPLLELAYTLKDHIPFEEIIKTQRWDLIGHALSRMDKDCMVSAVVAGIGALPILRYLYEEGFDWHLDTCAEAAEQGHLDCLQYAHEKGCPWDTKTHIIAAQNGHMHCLEYAHKQGLPWHSDVCAYAALGGSLACLRYAHENGCPWGCDTVQNAAQRGHFSCLRYALGRGCAFDIDACNTACKHGNLECLQLPLDYGAPFDKSTCMYSAMCSDSTCLQLLFEIGCPWDENTVLKAALKGAVDSLRCALEQGCPYYDYTMEAAAIGNSLECLQYLVDVQSLSTDEEVLQVAVLRGNLSCVQFLVDRDCPLQGIKFSDDPVQIELFDEYFRRDNPEFVQCVQYVVDRGWIPDKHFINCVATRDERCTEWLQQEGWLGEDSAGCADTTELAT